ncbi:MAG: xylulokinase [Actinomycetota bacterium]
MAVFVGCDLGTTGSKAAVVADDGTLLGQAAEEVPLRRPGSGLVEQDMLEIESSAHRVVRGALADAGSPRRVAAVAFSSQMSGVGTIDAGFAPATRYDSWLDTRCEPYIRQMAEHADRITELSGCPPTYSHGPKLLYWRTEHPEAWSRIARFVVPSAFVAGRLAGMRSADQAYLDRTYLHFTNLADNRSGEWSNELLSAFDLDGEKLPRLVDPTDVIGEVDAEGAERSGLPRGTPIAAGAGDTTAAALGAGLVVPGRVFDVAGTASVLAMCLAEFRPDVEHRTLMACRGVAPGTFLSLAFINGGGLALRWLRDEIASDLAEHPDAYERLVKLAEAVEPGSEDLLWFPHLQGRVLPPEPYARGAWVGLTSRHGRGHLVRSVLEGIAYQYAEWAQLATAADDRLHETRVLGGGATSRLWNQIKADVLGIPWVPTLEPECGIVGDALIAAASTGHVDDLAGTADTWQRTGVPVEPQADAHERYRRLVDAYRVLSASLTPVFDRLGGSATGAGPVTAGKER